MESTRDTLLFSDDKVRLDVRKVHAWLESSYWARGIPLETMERAIAGSDCFGVYENGSQIAFARLITDRTTFAYLCDVFVDQAHRGHGIGRWMMECIQSSSRYQGLRRWMLATHDAHDLYRQLGWEPLDDPSRFMQKFDPEIYSR